jgi:hypothetical protein
MSTVGTSRILINNQGGCLAYLSPAEVNDIQKLTRQPVDSKWLETGVGRVVQGAFVSFLQDEKDAARRLLSTVEDDAIFVTDFSKTRGYRIQTGIAVAAAAILIICSFTSGTFGWNGLYWYKSWDGRPVSRNRVQRAVGDWVGEKSLNPHFPRLWVGGRILLWL